MNYFFKLFVCLIFAYFIVGCTTIATSGADRRPLGTQIDDSKIDFGCPSSSSDEEFRIQCLTYNYNVLVTGQAADQKKIDQLIAEVKKIENVKKVINRMTVGSVNDDISGDAKITADVIEEIIEEEGVSKFHVQVYTELGVTYLLGSVFDEEAQAAIKAAKRSTKLKKLEPLFQGPVY
jgi:osmotically-inducible protein OsmY